MPRPKTGKPPGRPKNKVAKDAHVYVRMTSAERDRIEKAAGEKAAADPMTGQLSVAQWLLKAGLAAADATLGSKK
jgi:hypothetical protein